MRFVKLLCLLIILVGCTESTPSSDKSLTGSLNELLANLGQEHKDLHIAIATQIVQENSHTQPNVLLLQTAMSLADDKLALAQDSIDKLMNIDDLSDDQAGLAYLFEATAHYTVGQTEALDTSLNQALLMLNGTSDPVLKFWLESYKVLLSSYRGNQPMFEQSVGYVLPRLNSAPQNLLGQSMLNVIAIGLTTGQRFNDAIDVENIKVARDEALGNVQGLSDSYYNLGTLYRHLEQPELALLSFMRCLEYAEQLMSDRDQAYALQQMTVVTLTLNDHTRAMEWAREAHSLALSSNTPQLYIPTKLTLAKVIAHTSPSESQKLLNEAKALSVELNVDQFLEDIKSIEKMLADN